VATKTKAARPARRKFTIVDVGQPPDTEALVRAFLPVFVAYMKREFAQPRRLRLLKKSAGKAAVTEAGQDCLELAIAEKRTREPHQ
jgi:hypothetical protein